MEDYEKFVEFHLCQRKGCKDVEKQETPGPSSLIRFHGRPILPPLLSGPQREEMVRLREAAQHRKKCQHDPRMSYVQTLLHSVPIRNTPTLDELLRESTVASPASSTDTINDYTPHCVFTENSLCHSFKPTEKVKDTLHPLVSTACDAFLTSHLLPQTSHGENSHHFHQASHSSLNSCSPPAESRPSFSSGYDNVENSIGAKGSYKETLFSENEEDSLEHFLNEVSTDTVKKMPDIINYPPIDGEELERSGQELSFVSDFKAATSENSSIIGNSSAEISSFVFQEQVEALSLSNQSDSLQNAEVKCGLMLQPKDASAPISPAQIHTELFETSQSDDEDSKLPEESYRISLQTLLKKSQEYRRRQRVLRSQAKNAKMHERAQDQPKSEDHSLSDKENDERHSKETQLKKSQEKSDTLSPTVNQSLKKSFENDGKREDICDESFQTIDSQGQNSILLLNSDSNDLIRINNWVNTSGPRGVSLPLPTQSGNLNKSSGRSAKTSLTGYKEVRNYHNIPAPNFCRSPVSCKVKRPCPPFDKISQKETVINKPINKEHKVEQSSSGTSLLNVVVESDVTSVLAKSSQHIDQLELNLSGLKVLISDLESTLTENVDTSSSQSESQQTQLSQNNLAGWSGDVHHTQTSQLPGSINSGNNKTSQMKQTPETIYSEEKQLVTTMMTSREKGQNRLTENTRRPSSSSKCILSATQRMLIPNVFRNFLPEATAQDDVSALSATSNHPETRIDSDVGHDSRSTSLNQSYDVEAPSKLWLHMDCEPQGCDTNQLTPENTSEGQSSGSKVKRRLQMTEDVQEKGNDVGSSGSRPGSRTPKAAARWHGGLDSVKERQEQLKQIHAAQIRALQEEHRRQQEQLLQALAARFRLLHSVSLPYSMSNSRLGDTVTFPTPSQPAPCPLPEHYRHLLSAAAHGFLTRRLLRTDRVAQLVRTVRDTQQFLKTFQQQSPDNGFCSRQDLMLQERVTLQLRATRYEIYDIFFSLSTAERMQLISMDRDLAREREMKRHNGTDGQLKRNSSLSAATQKSLERKRGLMIQKKTAEKHKGAGTRIRHKPSFSAEQPLETRAGQFRANPQRVPKSTYTSRPR